MTAGGPFAAAQDGVTVSLRVTPGAARTGFQGLQADADGRRALKVAVAAAPEAGKANAALIKLLARNWGVSRSSISIVRGSTGRHKTVRVEGEPGPLLARLERWLGENTG